MGPIRTEKLHEAGESSSTSSKSKSKPKRRHAPKGTAGDSPALPGVQKLKASLRQTRRLLAKNTLAADVRVETERRLKALEADIAQAESARKERSMSVRYHKVKFFERQKVVRKITQTKKQLATCDLSGSSKKKAEASLYDLRVDLNYILHYPKTNKYISLFPPEVRKDVSDTQTSQSEVTKTNIQRDQVRKWVRERMEKAELSCEPEINLDVHSKDDGGGHRSGSKISATELSGMAKTKGKHAGNSESARTGVEGDAFFGDDGSDDENEVEGMDEDEEEGEIAEYDTIDGFPDWSRRDFQQFFNALEAYGWTVDFGLLAIGIQEKTPQEVKQYYLVFE